MMVFRQLFLIISIKHNSMGFLKKCNFFLLFYVPLYSVQISLIDSLSIGNGSLFTRHSIFFD